MQHKCVPDNCTTQVVAHALALRQNHVTAELKVVMSPPHAMMASLPTLQPARFRAALSRLCNAVMLPSTGGCLLYNL